MYHSIFSTCCEVFKISCSDPRIPLYKSCLREKRLIKPIEITSPKAKLDISHVHELEATYNQPQISKLTKHLLRLKIITTHETDTNGKHKYEYL